MKEEILKSISDWNPWMDEDFPKKLLGIKRDQKIIDYLNFKEIKILEGARRVGKSTLMYEVIFEIFKTNKNVLYLNFDDEILRKYSLSKIYEIFLEKKKIDYLFIDEIQNCENWVHFIRKLYDTKELKQIWITGSNSSLIKQEYSSLLTGRNITLNIKTLNFNEFLRFKKFDYDIDFMSTKKRVVLKTLFDEYLRHGAFPEVVLREVNHKELLINYYEDFLYKDIVSRYNVNSRKLKELGLYLSSNSSKLISYRGLAKTLNLNYNSVVDYISYFLEVYLFSLLYKYDYSLNKQISNERKIYSIDSGLSNAISFKFSEDIGRILENTVFLELKRRGKEIYYHKDKFECDFVVKEGMEIVGAIQVTKSLNDEKTKKREITGLIDAMSKYKLKKGLIITQDDDDEILIDGFTIKIMSIQRWLLISN